MLLTLRAASLVLFVSVCAQAQSRTLALYAGPAPGLNTESALVMRAELQRLLVPAGLQVVWKDSTGPRNGEDFALVAVSTFEGSCSPAKPGQTGVAATLADTSMSNGRVLPFFRVDCTRLIQVLGRSINSRVLGRALARVIAHELYHIVARTADHQDSGVAKAVFSAQDLTDIRFEFDSASISRMQLSPLAGFSDISAITER